MPGTARLVALLNAGLAAATLAGVAGWFVAMAPRGLNLFDESFYLLNARHGDMPTYFSSFGRFLARLLWLTGGALAPARVAGAAILLALTLAFAAAAVRFLARGSATPPDRLRTAAIVMAAGAATIVYYREWLPTPSYNWLALCGTLACGTALLLGERARGGWRTTIATAALLGAGGAVATLGKVTTGAALALVCTAWLAASPQRRHAVSVAAIAAAVAIGLVLLHVALLEGGVRTLVARALETASLERLLGARHTPGDGIAGALRETLAAPWSVVTAAPVTAAVALALLGYRVLRRAPVPPRTALVAFAALAAGWIAEVTLRRPVAQLADGWPAAALVVVAAVVFVAGGDRQALRSRRGWRLAALLGALPLAYAFGSNVGLYNQAGSAFVFPALAVLLIAAATAARSADERVVTVAVVAIGAYLAVVVASVHAHPWRQPAGLSAQRFPICVLGTRTCAAVDAGTRAYAERLRRGAVGAGWRPGLPIIVLTGHTPGVAALLDGRPVGTHWLYGGFDGSDAYTVRALRLDDPATLRRAWVVTAPGSPGALTPALLRRVGLDFPNGYRQVLTLVTPFRAQRQVVWQPAGQERR